MKATSKPLGPNFHLQKVLNGENSGKTKTMAEIIVKVKLLSIKGTTSQDKICEIQLKR